MVEEHDMGASLRDRAATASQPSPAVSGIAGIPSAEPDDVVWLRDLDGTGSMHVCTPHDPGAIPYYRGDA